MEESMTKKMLLSLVIFQLSLPTSLFAQEPPTRPTIGNIDASMLPGLTCPLVDNQPRKDLLAASENLAKSIAPIKQCKGSTNVESMQDYIKSVIQAGKTLKTLIEEPEQMTGDKSQLRSIQVEVEILIRGIDQISQVLTSNSPCAKEMQSNGLLTSLNDLVQAVTPFAMLILEANPAFAPAIPFVLGLSGAGNVAKVIQTINNENSLDMKDDKTRLAVLQNICEYTRIKQRVSLFNKAKVEKYKEVTDRLGEVSAFSKKIFSKYSAQAQQIFQDGEKVKQNLTDVRRASQNDQSDLADIRNSVKGEQDSKLACGIARSLVKRAANPQQLPTRAIINMKAAMTSGSGMSESAQIIYSSLLTSEEVLRKKILREIDQDSPWAFEQCASDGKSYVEALYRLVNSTQNLAVSLQSKVDEKLLKHKNREVRSLAKEQLAVRSEDQKIKILVESASEVRNGSLIANSRRLRSNNQVNNTLLDILNKDNGVMVDDAINRNMKEVGLALFGERSSLIPYIKIAYRGESPAYSWYRDADEFLRVLQQEFSSEVQVLKNQAVKYYTRTGQRQLVIKLPGGHSRDVNQKDIANDYKAAELLAPMTLRLLKEDSTAHKDMCLRLNNIMDKWYGILNHLGSMFLYCSYITNYFNEAGFDSRIVSACKGVQDWTLQSRRNSKLTQLRLELAQKSGTDANLIEEKISELKCE
jgi:hypothetical protein